MSDVETLKKLYNELRYARDDRRVDVDLLAKAVMLLIAREMRLQGEDDDKRMATWETIFRDDP